MAKRNKTKKLFKSNLKLEALEQRQLLAGITGSGTELTPGGAGANNFITASNGNHYDQVLLTGTSVSVTNDVGNITRVSFLDLQGDIVQAEFGGAGTLTISLDPTTALPNIQPVKYNQTLATGYEQGLASFSIQGSDATTNFTVFSVGAGTAFAGNTLFDSTHTGGNNTADVQRLTIVANPANPNGSTFGGIRAGNAIFGAASGVVGISAANVQVQDVVTVGDIKATGTATPTLDYGDQSQFVNVTLAGGGLVEANGASINNTASYKFGITFASGADSTVLPSGTPNLPAQTAPVGLSFSGDNPIAAQVKTFTLTSGVDAIAGSAGNDAINGQLGGTPTLTALDTIDGGAGTDSLSINDVDGGNSLPSLSIKNIEIINLASAKAAGAIGAGNSFDTSAIAGVTTLNVLQSKGADYITAGSGQAVTVFDTAGTVNLTGGSTQTVTTAGGLVLKGAAGAITATDTAQGIADSAIDGGTTVNLTNSATVSGGGLTGKITVGGLTPKPTGVVTITSNLTGSDTYVGDVAGGNIAVTGGTTVTVAQTASVPVNPTVGSVNTKVTQSAVTVTGAAGVTTAVTVTETPPIKQATTAVAAVATTEVDAITFTDLTAGKIVTLGGLTYTAPAGGANAATVAAAFASLPGAALTGGGGYTTGAASGASNTTVTFTATGTGAHQVTVAGNTLVDTIKFAAIPAVVAPAVGKTVTILGMTYDDQALTGGAGSTAIQVANFFASQAHIGNGTPGIDWTSASNAGTDTVVFTALATGTSDVKITASGTNATAPTITETSAVTIGVTVAGASKTSAGGRGAIESGIVTIADANVGTNTIATVSLTNYGLDTLTSVITSNALTNLTLKNTSVQTDGHATSSLTINNTVATTLDLTVDGAKQAINTISNPSNTYTTLKVHVPTNDTTLTGFTDTGLTSLTVDGTKKLTVTNAFTNLTTVAVSGSAGLSMTAAASVTDVNASATSGAMSITLNGNMLATYEGGSGADNVTISGVPTLAISGGAGTDTLTLKVALANPSANSNLSGFESLAIATGGSGSYDATGFTALSNGIAGITFANVAAGVPLSVTGGDTTYNLKDSGAGSADTLTIDVKGTATVNTAGLESVAVTANDATNALTLTDSTKTVTSITVSNSKSGKPLTLTATGNTALTTVNASAMSGALIYTTEGSLVETVTGGSDNDQLTAKVNGKGDKLIGGPGDDTLTANNGLDTLTGGTGNDTFVIATPGVNLNGYSVITDAAAGDLLQLANKGTEVWTKASANANLQNTASFQNFADKVVTDGGDSSTNGHMGWFQFNGDTYVVESLHDATVPADAHFKDGFDIIVKLSGLIDLSGASFLQSGTLPEIIIR